MMPVLWLYALGMMTGRRLSAGLLGLIIIFIVFVFWLWMLIDLLKRKKFEDKLVWVLVLVFLNLIGAILYYFLAKAKEKK
jgi:uncharacterized membrane protein YphA (DoxX/SURF4 family)